MVSTLTARTDVLLAEPDYLGRLASVPNDPYWPDPGMWNLRQVAAPSGWDITTGTASVVVGVLDSGARYTHQDLAANMWNNPGGIGTCPAMTHGYDFVNNTCYPTDVDYASHGTANTGIIGAAGNNLLGLTGMNWTTSIMALKVATDSSEQSVMSSRVIAAIDFAVQAKLSGINIRVLNASIITEGYSHLVQDEINTAGDNNILTVVAAGNASCNLDSACSFYPASLNLGTMVTVAATGPNGPSDDNDNLAGYSNYGSSTVHLGAPGGSYYNRLDVLGDWADNAYSLNSTSWGTSEAAPLVAGAAALVLAACPSLSVYQLKYTIMYTGDLDFYLTGKTVTGRRLNVNAAIRSCR